MNKQIEIFEELYKFAEIDVTYKRRVKAKDRVKITQSSDFYNGIKPYYGEQLEYKEKFFVAALNRANKIVAISKISEGGISGTVVDPRIIMQMLLLNNASAFIISHNHPSGSLNPSESDIHLTEKLKKIGNLLEIKLLDHIIAAEEGYYSFADDGKI